MAKKAAQTPPLPPKEKGKGKSKPKQRTGSANRRAGDLLKPVAVTMPPPAQGTDARVLDRLWGTILFRKDADPAASHSARLLSRGTAKVAQKFGEEAVECLIEAVGGHRAALICESADVLYHLLVLWVDAGVRPEQVWNELTSREAISGVDEKAARVRGPLNTTKIP